MLINYCTISANNQGRVKIYIFNNVTDLVSLTKKASQQGISGNAVDMKLCYFHMLLVNMVKQDVCETPPPTGWGHWVKVTK